MRAIARYEAGVASNLHGKNVPANAAAMLYSLRVGSLLLSKANHCKQVQVSCITGGVRPNALG